MKSKKKKKKKKKVTAAEKRKLIIIKCTFYKTIGICSICIEIVLKEGSGGPPPENFYRFSTKLGNSRHF